MKRSELVRQGYAVLATAEHSVDTALSDTATLAAELGRLRREAKLSLVVGQEAIDEVVEAVARLNDARRALVRAHNQLSLVKEKVAPGAIHMNGSLGDKGPPDGISSEAGASIHRIA